ncbi:MAG TPA: ABC transporter permease [Bacteroidales bacterium]|nr:ABC transporter permease [Bacteroidales bacterium]HNS46754.1 ABC transporter permease [Bacteroidales bacterium]
MLFFKLLIESYLFAINAIVINKVRTVLSLSGITIGIFSIISVFTVFDSMEMAIKNSLSTLGNDVLFVTKWPMIGDANMPWWKYWNRPEPSITDLREVQRRTQAAEAAAIDFALSRTIKYQGNYVENATVHAVSQDYDKVISFELADGRYFTPIESASGKPVAIIGHEIAVNLFENLDPIGKDIKVMGSKVEVIGVIAKEGSDNFGNSHDSQLLLPINFARNYVNTNEIGMTIMVKAKTNVSTEELKDELIGVMRSIRKLKPSAEDNFEIGEISQLTAFLDKIFGVISIVGWIIGGFALLVGGFGIANIMFVSVKERTSQIGIQKSLGAKNYFILLQFIFEAVFLSLFGGILGLILVYIGTVIAEKPIGMELFLTGENILIALLVSGGIGLIFGFIPAYSAARLDPVKAMRSTF